jgi:hypothetical protein
VEYYGTWIVEIPSIRRRMRKTEVNGRIPQWYLGALLLAVFWCGACTGARDNVETRAAPGLAPLNYNQELMRQLHGRQHYFDRTEVDLEHGDLEPASRYSRPRGVQQYRYDKTTVDLARPRAKKSEEAQGPEARPTVAPATGNHAPIPGGDR